MGFISNAWNPVTIQLRLLCRGRPAVVKSRIRLRKLNGGLGISDRLPIIGSFFWFMSGQRSSHIRCEFPSVTAFTCACLRSADQTNLTADGYDVAHCVAQLVDAKGIPVRHMDQKVRFTIEGHAVNIGVDNGSTKCSQDFQSDTCFTDEGRCLMVLQAGDTPGAVKVTVSADGLKGDSVNLKQK
jgi:hypothetical protein